MIRSMTGYGIGRKAISLGRVTAEARSNNHRYLDISLKLPKKLLSLETRIKEMVKAHFSRGRFDISIEIDSEGKGQFKLEPNIEVAQMYVHVLETLKSKLKLTGEVSLDLISREKDVITAKEVEGDIDPSWEEISRVLLSCLEALEAMRRSEGKNLALDLEKRLKRIIHQMEEVKSRSPSVLEAYRKRLLERLAEMIDGMEIDRWRLHQEVAYFAERSDITEEVVRIESHLKQFGQMLESDEPIGRKMDFLLQELNREVNTISAKASDVIISQKVVEIKAELEKMREQIQNIE
ncbi:MAG: YicC family protein [Syntrophobacterales bacterium]|nr:MAG: YicC family protein [Syntrophobacterales bacterium]